MAGGERAAALRDHLTRWPPTGGFRLVDVREEEDEVAVVFRWRRNPHTFVIRFGTDFTGYFGEEEIDDRDETTAWCDDIGFWLMEELDTGHLVRATRHRDGEEIVLGAPAAGGPALSSGVWVDDVPQYAPEMTMPWRIRVRLAARLLWARLRRRPASLGWAAWAPGDEPSSDGRRDGEWMAEAGLDPARVRQVRDEGRLLAWLQALGEGPELATLGQCAVVSTRDPGVALVEVLELAGGAPVDTRRRLVESAVHAAADVGARAVEVPGAGGSERIDTALCSLPPFGCVFKR